jgi:hypothetical protein
MNRILAEGKQTRYDNRVSVFKAAVSEANVQDRERGEAGREHCPLAGTCELPAVR